MTIQIALLRGINVGGNNTISMKELKEAMKEAGFEDTVTYINSGNVLFSSEEDPLRLREVLELLIYKTFGLTIDVLVVPAADLAEALEAAPAWWGDGDEKRHNALFVFPSITAEEFCMEAGEIKPEYESLACHNNIIFWSANKDTLTKTRFLRIIGTSIYKQVTIRNSNTTFKLMDIARKMGEGAQ